MFFSGKTVSESEPPKPLRILDLGCGPERLTERFLPDGIAIVRADVDRFSDDSVVLLIPGEPLPFEDDAFDIVLAMDVLEHVPPEGRDALLAECRRVAARAVILCCPTNDSAVVQAERDFQDAVRHLTGTNLPFLDEHAGLGLPNAEAVAARFPADWRVHVLENAPLDQWLLFNLVDFIYAIDLGNGPQKNAYNAAVNGASCFQARGQAHYRRFFCALRDETDRAAMAAHLQVLEEAAAACDPAEASHVFARHLPILRNDLRNDLLEALVRKEKELAAALIDRKPASGPADAQASIPPEDAAGTAADVLPDPVPAPERRGSLIERVENRLNREARHARTFARFALPILHSRNGVRGCWGIAQALTALGDNPLFQEDYYRAQNPDVGAGGVHPLVHYLQHGWREGRKPHPQFDPAFYLREHPDVAASGIEPLEHFTRLGWREGRRPAPVFAAAPFAPMDIGAALSDEHVPVEAPPSPPKFIYPPDWFQLYPGAQIITNSASLARGTRIEVLERVDFLENRHDTPAAILSISRRLGDNAVEWRLGEDLPAGEYVLKLVEDGQALDWRGVIVSAPRGRWAQAFNRRTRRTETRPPPARASALPLFSITTTVYDTPPLFLRELATCIRDQDFGDFEWLLLDNGSKDPQVVDAVRKIAASDPRFRYFRVEDNIHIIPGNYYLLQRAAGRYIVPVDSDDYLYPFALSTLAARLDAPNPPKILFSDEAKLSPTGEPAEPIRRPEYSRTTALSTCPAAHVLVFDRLLARTQGVYSEVYAQGSHDWDTMLRLTDAGASVGQVRACLYGWRMHATSTSLSDGTKEYIRSSQEGVIEASLRRRGLLNRFRIAPLSALGYYTLHRLPVQPVPVEIDLLLRSADETVIGNASANIRACRYPMVTRVRILCSGTLPDDRCRQILVDEAAAAGLPQPVFGVTDAPASLLGEHFPVSIIKLVIGTDGRIAGPDDWIWEVVGTLELDERVGVVGGALLDETGGVRHMGWHADAGGYAPLPPLGLFPSLRHAVLAVWGGLVAVRCAALAQLGGIGGVDADEQDLHGLEYGLRGRSDGWLSVFHPSLAVQSGGAPQASSAREDAGKALALHIAEHYRDLLQEDPYWRPEPSADDAREESRDGQDEPAILPQAGTAEQTVPATAGAEDGTVRRATDLPIATARRVKRLVQRLGLVGAAKFLARRNRSPALEVLPGNPLFQASYYLKRNPDVAASGIDPLIHYAVHGWREGRKPHPLFEPRFYLEGNPDVAASGTDPLTHYVVHGWREGRKPHPLFEPRFYLEGNPDVAASGTDPLTHYVVHGWREGRKPNPVFNPPPQLSGGRGPDEGDVEWMEQLLAPAQPGTLPADPDGTEDPGDTGYCPPAGLLPWFTPLNIRVSRALADRPHLNVLVPGLGMKQMSGGPNTAINLAYRLAACGVPVRFVATDVPIDADPAPFWQHVRALSNVPDMLPHASLVDASNRAQPLEIGANDVFMATAWWTAQMAKYALRHTNHSRFVYLIQDYEPILHPASTQLALAEETYGLDHIPVINTSLLHRFLAERKIGRYADPTFAEKAIVFEPAIDRSHFRAGDAPGERRKLLFYARPKTGLRNLFELGVAALQKAISDGVFDPAEWDFIGMGEDFAAIPLGGSAWLRPAPWLDFAGYANQMRTSDLLLSPMLSPHPSYPPIEMALCGKPAVTTVFANKTAERLAEVSPNIIGVPATIEALSEGLAEARRRLDDGALEHGPHGAYPGDWSISFADTVPRLFQELLTLFGVPPLPPDARLPATPRAEAGAFPGYRRWPASAYERLRLTSLAERKDAYDQADPGLISFLTTVWNTDPVFVAELAESVFGQDSGPGFEWIILDNGSVRADTIALLEELGRHPCVRLHRVERNLGIIGGMRHCLERARNRYIVPLDSDDLLTPDCVRVVTTALARAGYPALAYTDEDKVLGWSFRDPYYKPDWDPVLFSNSCYIAHLCCIDRERALSLDVYGDARTEGSHDWDSFTRFHRAGHTPFHIPELLYTWRMHESSTACNINSKSYITDSQRAVLEKFLDDRKGRYTVEPSPLFTNTPDWVFRRTREAPSPVTTVVLHAGDTAPAPQLDPAIPHNVVRLAPKASLTDLLEIARSSAERGALVHLQWAGIEAEGDEWPWDAMACFELFPDTAIVGGRIRQGDRVTAAAAHFGFGRGCDTPDAGRHVGDPGYFAQMFKMRSVSAVPVQHCVVSAAFLAEALPALVRAGVGFAYLGAWLGAAAHDRNLRVVYSPLFLGGADGAAADLESLVPDVEREAFRIAYAGIMPDRALLSPHLGLTPETAYRPVLRVERERQDSKARSPRAASYQEEAQAALIARLVRHPLPTQPFSLSILTIVYEKTPIECFRELARSLFGQTVPFTEWVVLRNGPVPGDLGAVLAELDRDPRVRRLDSDVNLGIIQGLRRCLEGARSDWVLPVDGDDLLVKDALQQIALAAERTQPAFIYSDEDVIRGTTVEAPYRRPDFDPVLNVADSYIWHACAFRRDKAMELGVFQDAETEYCQDWDTVARFAMAGEPIAHIPEVLYHWRHHLNSFSNSGTTNTGSRRSAERVMAKVIAAQADPGLYEIGTFPISRGQEQSAILRRPVSPLPMEAILLANGTGDVDAGRWLDAAAGLCGSAHPVAHAVTDAGAACSTSRLASALAAVSAAHVLVLHEGLRVEDATALWEAMRLFEMHPDVVLAGGRVLDARGRVAECCAFASPDGTMSTPWLNLDRNDPGVYALALKPRSAATVPDGFFLARTAFLREALRDGAPANMHATGLGGFLGTAARRRNRRVAYSPLIEAWIRP
ncbi:glycosyltransferase [Azospirillum brasilense]|uniref:rhamnosyltransferase WsaF family glycosyltransferase n=1 Tax=Azospirillum brasilense TaxID=192 RepID=UPI001478CB7C|nr:glycosyltransferase [Azospirillum brasilense]